MKTNYRILSLMLALKIIKLGDFYSISITDYDLTLQGHYKTGLCLMMKKIFKDLEVDSQGYISSEREIQGMRVKIALT